MAGRPVNRLPLPKMYEPVMLPEALTVVAVMLPAAVLVKLLRLAAVTV